IARDRAAEDEAVDHRGTCGDSVTMGHGEAGSSRWSRVPRQLLRGPGILSTVHAQRKHKRPRPTATVARKAVAAGNLRGKAEPRPPLPGSDNRSRCHQRSDALLDDELAVHLHPVAWEGAEIGVFG